MLLVTTLMGGVDISGLPNTDHKRHRLEVMEPMWRYCPNCGQALLHAAYAGVCGLSPEEADKKTVEILEKEGMS